jgi:hypothetical protein
MYVSIIFILALAVAGCAKTEITSREQLVTEKLPKPANIWVYDFAATPADIPADSAFAGKFESPPQTDVHMATGRKLGNRLAVDLVKQINAMGMPAKHATASSKPQVNDLVLRGYLLSSEEGKTGRRVLIGLGAGTTDLQAAAEGFQVTPTGLRRLGYGSTEAKGGKTPGVGVGAATYAITGSPVGLIVTSGMKLYGEKSGKGKIEGRVDQTAKEIADILKKRFQEQGWI